MSIIPSILNFFSRIDLEKALILLFVFSMLAEWVIGKLTKKHTHHKRDSITNFVIGGISFSFDFLFTLLMLPLWYFVFNELRIFDFHTRDVWMVLLLFLLIDFMEYWFHRLSHEVNLLWSAHVVHHQSEYFNLTVGLRTSLFVPLFNALFYSIFPILGFDPDVMLYIIFLQGIYQLFIHTELIGKLGWIDYVFVTPSVHRVHHGKNEKYIDKNYGKFLLVWDHIFGTFQRETETVEFGITAPLKKSGALFCIFEPLRQLIKLVKSVGNKKEKQMALFGNPSHVSTLVKKTENDF